MTEARVIEQWEVQFWSVPTAAWKSVYASASTDEEEAKVHARAMRQMPGNEGLPIRVAHRTVTTTFGEWVED